ncbi:MAG: response regulator transcription factor, partial [Gemmatimonadaceae bacterium]|nr:response regulator transcription factor [Gemmatimonadaceae bacterium]
MIRVLIADDHRIVRDGVRRLLADTRDIRVVAEASTGNEATAALGREAVDVVLLDISMPSTSFADTLSAIRTGHPSVRVIVMSAHAEEEYALRALKAGALGYVTKERSPDELRRMPPSPRTPSVISTPAPATP